MQYHAWIACACLLVVGLTANAESGPYAFELVARQFDTVAGQDLDFFRGVALDEQGRVAYTAVAIDETTQDLTGAALLLDRELVVATGTTIGNGELGFLGEPSLASNGTIAYGADVFQQGVGLSNTGVVLGPTDNAAAHQRLVGRNTLIGGVALEGAINPSINAAGDFAYSAIYFDSVLGINASAIVTGDTVVAATGDVVGDYVVSTVDRASLNLAGDLAFQADLINLNTAEPATGIFHNGSLTAISGAISDGLNLIEVFSPAVNRNGDLAYVARYFDVDANLENTAVLLNGQVAIASGDTTDEGLIIDLIEDIAINASGQIAFHATFIDSKGTSFFEEGVFLATIVPEPSSLLGVAVAGLLVTIGRRGRRGRRQGGNVAAVSRAGADRVGRG